MKKNELVVLFVLGHRLGLQSPAVVAMLKAHGVDFSRSTFGDAVCMLADQVQFWPVGRDRGASLVRDVVELFEKLE